LPVLQIDPAKVGQVNADDFDVVCEKMNEMTDKLIELQEEAEASRKQAEEDRRARMREEVRALQAERAHAEKERQVEESKKEAASAKAQAKADVDVALRRQKEEFGRRTGKITAKREGGKGVGGNQLWNDRAEDIVMVNDTGVAVNFSTNLGKNVNVPAKSRVSQDWAFNAFKWWEIPDVTVFWVAATAPEQSGSMLVKAGEVLRLSQ